MKHWLTSHKSGITYNMKTTKPKRKLIRKIVTIDRIAGEDFVTCPRCDRQEIYNEAQWPGVKFHGDWKTVCPCGQPLLIDCSSIKTENVKSFVQAQADYKQREFNEKAKELIWQLTEGGGSKNIHVLDSLRSLEWAYLTCAAYKMVAKDEKG